jgi:hypothetical protein
LMRPTPPVLDSRLKAPCPPVDKPAPDYDAWGEWAIDLLGKYGQCAAQVRELNAAWPK